MKNFLLLFSLFFMFSSSLLAQGYIASKGIELSVQKPIGGDVQSTALRLGFVTQSKNLSDKWWHHFGFGFHYGKASSGAITVKSMGPDLYYHLRYSHWLGINAYTSLKFRGYSGGTITDGSGTRLNLGTNLYIILPFFKRFSLRPIVGYTYQTTNAKISYNNGSPVKSKNVAPFFYVSPLFTLSIKKITIGLYPEFLYVPSQSKWFNSAQIQAVYRL
jgi:hypothetical protein